MAVVMEAWIPADTFGARLALLRQSLGMNVSEAATYCGLPGATWATWEHGAQPRRYEEITARISIATGCDLAWLRGVEPAGRQLRLAL